MRTHSKPSACMSSVAKLSRAESTAGKTEDTDGWWEQEKVRHTRGGGLSHLGGQTSVYPQDTSPSQYRTLRTAHFTDWPRQALAGQRWGWSAIGCLSWQWLTRAKRNTDNAVWHSYTTLLLCSKYSASEILLYSRKTSYYVHIFGISQRVSYLYKFLVLTAAT